MKNTKVQTLSLAAILLTLVISPALAQTDSNSGTAEADEQAAAQELVKQTLNPLASLVSVPSSIVMNEIVSQKQSEPTKGIKL